MNCYNMTNLVSFDGSTVGYDHALQENSWHSFSGSICYASNSTLLTLYLIENFLLNNDTFHCFLTFMKSRRWSFIYFFYNYLDHVWYMMVAYDYHGHITSLFRSFVLIIKVIYDSLCKGHVKTYDAIIVIFSHWGPINYLFHYFRHLM